MSDYLDSIGFQSWASSRGAKTYSDGDHDLGLYHESQMDDGMNPGKVRSGASERELRDSYAISESTDAQGRKRFGTEGTQFGDSGGFFDEDRLTAVDTSAGKRGIRTGDDADEADVGGMRENARKVYDAYKASGRELGWYDDKWGYVSDPEFFRDFEKASAVDNQKANAFGDMIPVLFMAAVTAGIASGAAMGGAAAAGEGAASSALGGAFDAAGVGTGVDAGVTASTAGAGMGGASSLPGARLYFRSTS